MDILGPENILFADASLQLSAGNFTGWGSVVKELSSLSAI